MTILDIVLAQPCRSYGEVLARMQALNAALPAGDGLRWFGNLYADMTKAVAEHAQARRFLDPNFLEQLDCRFAELYFAALASYLREDGTTPSAWRPLFERRFARDLAPVQFAVAGINAHINRDLPVALVATYQRFASAPSRDNDRYIDYRAVDQILADVHAQVKTRLITGLLAEGDAALGQLDDVIELWSLERAREAAWQAAELRWHLRDIAFLSNQHLATLDGLVGLASRGILRPGLALLA